MRSKLFVPASRPELYSKAMGSKADGISFDLEDAVEESRKKEARQDLAAWLQSQPVKEHGEKVIIVRCNGIGTPHFHKDIEAVALPAVHIINLPKVESGDAINSAVEILRQAENQRGISSPIGILANIESPNGLQHAADIAVANPRVRGLQIGFGDLFKPLGIQSSSQVACQHVRMRVRLAAGVAGIEAYDGAFVDISDPDGYMADAKAAHALGFAGKSCIHPSQVPLANRAFLPDPEEVAHALRVVEAARKNQSNGTGAFVVDGRLVDGPFITSAQQLLDTARRAGMVGKCHED